MQKPCENVPQSNEIYKVMKLFVKMDQEILKPFYNAL